MFRQIVIEAEPTDGTGSMFRLSTDAIIIAEDVTAIQATILVGEVLERIHLSNPGAIFDGNGP
jgi:hypothetical protein